MPMVTLYITRHGETEWNQENKIQGWHDSRLTIAGKNSANLVGERVNPVHFDAVFSSPSGRIRETTNFIVREKEIPIFYDDRLKELKMGDWEGKTISYVKATYPAQYDQFFKSTGVI